MERAIPLGRLAGVRIGMSWVVPFVAVLYALTLRQGPLPAAVPGEPPSTYWAVAVVGAALFFLSLLAHEMGHALVGRREGMDVRGITLTLFGGHTQFATEAGTPGAELRVSGVGPLANVACAAVFLLLGLAVDGGLGPMAVVGEMLAWLAFVNLLLAAVNLLPGDPLDGGAVLGALVWMVTGDRTRAQTVTATIGFVMGVVLLVGGGWLLLAEADDRGLWLLLIGAFMAGNARSRLRAAPALGALREARIGAVMQPDPPVVPEWTTLSDVVARAPGWAPHTAFPVQASDGRITGLLTAELVMAVDPHDWPAVRAVDVAWPLDRVPTALVDDPVLATLQRSEAAAVDRVLVLWPDGRVAGVAGHDAGERALRQRARS
ncbi:MAG TPA: site-2 protease family protein [Acidimicrobiales bacterium]|nr:site-2 protease family protein [Acidimicrobiales bacterium]